MDKRDQIKLKALADAGLIISFCYGNTGKGEIWWSVNVLNTNNGESFEKPFAAFSIQHAVEIANKECKERNWV